MEENVIVLQHGQPFELAIESPEPIGSWTEVWMQIQAEHYFRRLLLVSNLSGLTLVNDHAAKCPWHGELVIDECTTSTPVLHITVSPAVTSQLEPDDEPLTCEVYMQYRDRRKRIAQRPVCVV